MATQNVYTWTKVATSLPWGPYAYHESQTLPTSTLSFPDHPGQYSSFARDGAALDDPFGGIGRC